MGPARGTMLVLHSGGWRDRRGDARRTMAGVSVTFRTSGWRVVNVGYSPGPRARGGAIDPRPMLRDVVAFYDQIRRAYGGPVCAYGESAGGHLAAMLALERPSLSCAILAAAPLDLQALLRSTTSDGAVNIRQAFGNRPSLLRQWSPTQLWDPHAVPTPVFATAAPNDQVVPPQQLMAFTAIDPAADARVVRGAAVGTAGAVPWMHSTVLRSGLVRRSTDLGRWLGRLVPRAVVAPTPRAASSGADCGPPTSGVPVERWRLLLAGDAWQQTSTAGQAIAATRGCSGSARRQDDGLSLWAFPSLGATLAAGSESSLVLRSSHRLSRLSATFRGYLARPSDWSVGLYASTRTRGPIRTPVAACERGRCARLRLVPTASGSLLAAARSHGDPDAREVPVAAAFRLPAGTRRLAWRLRCVAAAGCSLTGDVDLRGRSRRPRDPLGHPAILSLYRVDVR